MLYIIYYIYIIIFFINIYIYTHMFLGFEVPQEGIIVAFDSMAGRYHVRLADNGVRPVVGLEEG